MPGCPKWTISPTPNQNEKKNQILKKSFYDRYTHRGNYLKYGAPFVTSRILLREYNSVGQNTILSDRIQFCLTELYSADRITFCPTEYEFCWQNYILLDRIVFCRQNCILSTELYSVQQNYILSNRIVFCPTEYNSVQQNTILSNRIQFCPKELYSVDRIQFCRSIIHRL